MNPETTPVDSLKILDRLAEKEANRRRKTVFVAWGSLVVAAVLLAVLVLGSGKYLVEAKQQLTDVTKQRDDAKQELTNIQSQTVQASGELETVRRQLADTRTELTNAQAEVAGLVQARDREPTVKPRAYVQIVDRDDRKWAEKASGVLREAGIVVPGIEYVPTATKIKRTDVRYYKKSEEAGAARIVSLLKSMGVDAQLTYLNQENNKNVRPNHFEVWFPADSRKSPSG